MGKKSLVSIVKDSIVSLCDCFERLCGEVANLAKNQADTEKRLKNLEEKYAGLDKLLESLEPLRLRLEEEVAKGTFTKVPDLEA